MQVSERIIAVCIKVKSTLVVPLRSLYAGLLQDFNRKRELQRVPHVFHLVEPGFNYSHF